MGGDGTVTYRPMPHDEHVKRLRSKLVEEALEYALDPSLMELAHVYEAMVCLARVDLGGDLGEVSARATEERLLRGGFDEGVGMYALHPWDRDGDG